MKKKTIILLSVAIVATLYALPWIYTCRSLFSLYSAALPPQTPEQFANQYPFLSAMLWFMRMDIFSRGEPNITAAHLSTTIHHICLLRHACISISVGLLCIVIALGRPFAGKSIRALARTTQVMLIVIASVGLGLATFSFVAFKRAVPYWDRQRGVNILNYYYRFGEMNRDVWVPESTQGAVLTKADVEDIHIEIDRRGWLSMGGAMLTRTQLVQIVSAKTAQAPSPRFILWVDYRCKAQDRDPIITIATNISPQQTYVVVREGDDSEGGNIEFKGLNHNKGIDPYFKRPNTTF